MPLVNALVEKSRIVIPQKFMQVLSERDAMARDLSAP
jgi:hypothetical protein